MVDANGNPTVGLQSGQQLQQQELDKEDARQSTLHDVEAGRHLEARLQTMSRQQPVPGPQAAEAVHLAEGDLGLNLRESSNSSRSGTAARANGSNEEPAAQNQSATGAASHSAHHSHAAGHDRGAPQAHGDALQMEPRAQQSSPAPAPQASAMDGISRHGGAAQHQHQQQAWHALLAGQASGGSAGAGGGTKAAQQRELWRRLQELHQAARAKAGLIPPMPQAAQPEQAAAPAAQGTAFPALAQSAAIQRLAALSQAARGHPDAAAGQAQGRALAADPWNSGVASGSMPAHPSLPSGLQPGGGAPNGWASPWGGQPGRPSSPSQPAGNGSAAGPHRAPDPVHSGAGLAAISGLLAGGQGGGRPVPGAAPACESERGGVPGEGAAEGAAFLASLQRHWHAEAAPDYVQGRCAPIITRV